MLKLVQITDCHLLADPQQTLQDVPVYTTFLNIANAVAKEAPDCVIASGDLAEDGAVETYQLMRQALESRGLNTLYFAGNHDLISNMRMALPNLMIDHSKRLGSWNLIFLNSIVEGKHHGFLKPASLAFLKQALLSNQSPTAIFVHHHPVPIGNAFIDSYNIHNSAEFINLLPLCPSLKFVCFGHVHQDFTTEVNGVLFLAAPATCFQFKKGIDALKVDYTEKPGYRVFDLFDDGCFNSVVKRLEGQSR